MLEFLIQLFSQQIISSKNSCTFKYQINNEQELSYLIELDFFNIKTDENKDIFSDDIIIGKTFEFDLIWMSLRKHGFYLTCEDFVTFYNAKKKKEFYILEISCTEKNIDNFFIKNYNDLILIIDFIIALSDDIIQEKCLIYFENRYLKILNKFNPDILSKTEYILDKEILKSFFEEYNKSSNEIKAIFKSELINFLNNINEKERLEHLYYYFSDFNKRCIIGYEYYVKDFSYIKAKTELDNAVLDFSKNIRTVVNDSQNKLIIIPAAIILAFTAFEIKDPFNIKNIFVLGSSVLFAYMMDSFVNNQESALGIIKTNISNYKTLFFNRKKSLTKDLNGMISDSFLKADDELERQQNWMLGIKIINWVIPALLFVYLLTLIYNMRSH